MSIAASGQSTASWPGLLASGVEYALAVGAIDTEIADICRSCLQQPDTDNLLAVASELADALGAPDGGQFAAWLDRDVGNLSAADPALPTAILGLKLPIVTTNYDSILERVGNREHVTWLQPGLLQKVLAFKSDAIAHFHGYYTEPSSVVLSESSYKLLLENQNIIELRNAVAAVSTILYIGFGDGIHDPNFSSLHSWIKTTLPAQSFNHYQLVSTDELALLAAPPPNVQRVHYGDTYADLVPFLERLETAGKVISASTSIETFALVENRIRASSIIGTHFPTSIQSAKIHELVIPPILFPMSHEQYVAATKEDSATRQSRCDLTRELLEPRLLLVADHNAGLSTALSWFAAKHHLESVEVNPVVVNFRGLGKGQRPLENEVRRQLRLAGFPISDRAALPPISLGLDNVHTADDRLLARVIAELGSGTFRHVAIGCRTGAEIELHSRLAEDEQAYKMRYLGRMRQDDVRQLAALVDNSRADEITEVAVRVARSQHLPTTPFTFSMIVSALLRGESLLGLTSQTALLDAYVTVLMGWGPEDEDSRSGLDSVNLSFVIGQLAQLFVEKRRGSLRQEVVIGSLADQFERLEWPDSPIDTLQDLQRRHILTIKGTEVAFAQSSYLHLFAAKRAQKSSSFLETLSADPLYFAPILMHYAALERDDVTLLQDVAALINDYKNEFRIDTGVFAVDSDRQLETTVSNELRRIDESIAQLPAAEDDEPLDERLDHDVEPFPLEPVDHGLPRHFATLALVSSILRDTEIIDQPPLRRQILFDLMTATSNFVYELERLPEFNEIIEEMSAALMSESNMSKSRKKTLSRDLRDGLALAATFSLMAANLSSKKLSRALEACLADTDFSASAGRAVLATVLAFDIQEPGWSNHFLTMADLHGETRAVANVMHRLAIQALVMQTLGPQDERNLVEFLALQAVGPDKNPEEMTRLRAQIRKSLIGGRIGHGAKMLPPGTSVISASELEQAEHA